MGEERLVGHLATEKRLRLKDQVRIRKAARDKSRKKNMIGRKWGDFENICRDFGV